MFAPWLVLPGVVLVAGVLAVSACLLVMRILLGYSGADSIAGLSPANFQYALNAGWFALAISITITLLTFSTLSADKKQLSILPAVLVPVVCAVAFFLHIASSMR